MDEQYYDDLSKYLAHLTTQRFLQGRGWDVGSMYQEIALVIEKFLKLCAKTRPICQ